MLPIKYRVPRENIKKVISGGEKSYSELFLFKKVLNEKGYNRYAVIVSKKVNKKAVKRHLIRRRFINSIKETVGSDIGKGYDVVCLVSPKASESEYIDILEEISTKKDYLLL